MPDNQTVTPTVDPQSEVPIDLSGPVVELDALKATLEQTREYLEFLQKDRDQFALRVNNLENEITDLRSQLKAPPTNPLVKTPENIETTSDKPMDRTPRVQAGAKNVPEDKTTEKTMTKP